MICIWLKKKKIKKNEFKPLVTEYQSRSEGSTSISLVISVKVGAEYGSSFFIFKSGYCPEVLMSDAPGERYITP